MDAYDILEYVAILDESIGPDTLLRWRRGHEWCADDEAQDALNDLRKAWRQYLAEREPKTKRDKKARHLTVVRSEPEL